MDPLFRYILFNEIMLSATYFKKRKKKRKKEEKEKKRKNEVDVFTKTKFTVLLPFELTRETTETQLHSWSSLGKAGQAPYE